MTATTELKPVEVGTIFVSSWGYDQTNVDFYRVARISPTGKTVWLQPIGKTIVPGSEGFMSEQVVPSDTFDPEPDPKRLLRRKLSPGWCNDGWWVNLTSYSGAGVWDGEPERASHYA